MKTGGKTRRYGRSLGASFAYAFSGLSKAVRRERNLKVHLGAIVIVTALGFYFKLSSAEWCIVVILFGLVVAGELFNTALEEALDLVSLKYNVRIEWAKDVAASGVLVLALAAAIVGLVIFVPKVIGLAQA